MYFLEYDKIFKLIRITNSMREKFDWFKTKQATAIFAVGSLIAGFFFLNQTITGNAILSENYSLNVIPIIGLVLILCSVILGAYSVMKRN